MDEEILFSWVHLSDLHALHGGAGERHDQHSVLRALTEDLKLAVEREGCPRPSALFFTGDIANRGGADAREYEEAGKHLRELAEAAGCPGQIFVVPGNHDVRRSTDKVGLAAVNQIRGGNEDVDGALADQGMRAILEGRLSGYLEVVRTLRPNFATIESWTETVPAGGLSVRIVGLNTALLANDDNDRGKLRVGRGQLQHLDRAPRPQELVVVLSHHPATDGWLADEKSVGTRISMRAHVHLSGHTHEQDAIARLVAGAEHPHVAITAGATHGDDDQHGYNFATIVHTGGGEVELRVYPRRWSKKQERFHSESDRTARGKDHASFKLGPLVSAGGDRRHTVGPMPMNPSHEPSGIGGDLELAELPARRRSAVQALACPRLEEELRAFSVETLGPASNELVTTPLSFFLQTSLRRRLIDAIEPNLLSAIIDAGRTDAHARHGRAWEWLIAVQRVAFGTGISRTETGLAVTPFEGLSRMDAGEPNVSCGPLVLHIAPVEPAYGLPSEPHLQLLRLLAADAVALTRWPMHAGSALLENWPGARAYLPNPGAFPGLGRDPRVSMEWPYPKWIAPFELEITTDYWNHAWQLGLGAADQVRVDSLALSLIAGATAAFLRRDLAPTWPTVEAILADADNIVRSALEAQVEAPPHLRPHRVGTYEVWRTELFALASPESGVSVATAERILSAGQRRPWDTLERTRRALWKGRLAGLLLPSGAAVRDHPWGR